MKKTFFLVTSFILFITNVFADILVNQPVSFSAKSETATKYEWTFPNGDKIFGKNITYTFQTTGNQKVKLIVYDGLDSKEIEKTILIKNQSKPTAAISVYKDGVALNNKDSVFEIMRNERLEFFSDSVNQDGEKSGITETWTVDGLVMSAQSIPQRLNTIGSFNIKLVVSSKDNINLRDEKTISVKVKNSSPEFTQNLTFKKDTLLGNANVVLSTLAKDADGTISNYRFEVLEYDSIVSAKISPTNTASFNLSQFTGAHKYQFKVTAIDNDGGTTENFCSEKLETNEFLKNSAPEAAIIVSPSTVGSTSTNFYFQAEASDPDRDSLDYKWTFPEGENTFYNTVNHRFTTSGTKQIKLEVSDGIETTEANLEINVIESEISNGGKNTSPKGSISGISPGNTGDTETIFSFYSEASDADGDELSYEWNFGNNQKMFLPNVSYKFSTSGTYNIKLKISDGLETIEKNISINVVEKGTTIPKTTIEGYEDSNPSALTEEQIKITSSNEITNSFETRKDNLELELAITTDPKKQIKIRQEITSIDNLLSTITASTTSPTEELVNNLTTKKDNLKSKLAITTDPKKQTEIQQEITSIDNLLNTITTSNTNPTEELMNDLTTEKENLEIELATTTDPKKQTEIQQEITSIDNILDAVEDSSIDSTSKLINKLETEKDNLEIELATTTDPETQTEIQQEITSIDNVLDAVKDSSIDSTKELMNKLITNKENLEIELSTTTNPTKRAELKQEIVLTKNILEQIENIAVNSNENLITELEDQKNNLQLKLKNPINIKEKEQIKKTIALIDNEIFNIENNSLYSVFNFDFITIKGTTNTVFFVYGKAPQSERALFFEWDLGDGRKQIGQNISTHYKTPSIYTLKLKVSDGLTTVFDSLKIKVEK